MEQFIRLDMKGNWKGKEHCSSFAGVEEHGIREEGISCYRLKDTAYALESLREYWVDMVGHTEKDFENMQITIFEGELVGKEAN
ncbi:hypothetical protein CG475_022300 (plasmid) [Bacillus cytotoxicus]|uniref:hypothetical protein n=1 Tax=Bacillus cytotoxicus TaxID=580165 RepID=UPI000B974990|nr:hypothetical protein [Bacillus cytotoxicus]AWC39067.1 hypothetical protein CG481_022485 [Bacillus cytotoxicus]AWC67297.1 hypothetical protein CG475_022300 [Bacillus cytotoxicus]